LRGGVGGGRRRRETDEEEEEEDGLFTIHAVSKVDAEGS
jgi:hypothetical protein